MQIPSPDPDTTFAELLQDLPPETQALAREFKAFARARKIKSAAQLLRAVLLFAGLDWTEREVTANLVLSDPDLKSLSDQSVHERLAACQPWLKALLPRLIARGPLPELPSGRRLLVVDGSTLTAPGQKKVSWRVHVMMDLVSLQLVQVQITDRKTGETLKQYELAPGDVVMADRGYCRRNDVVYAVTHEAEVVIRYSAHNFPVQDAAGQPLAVAQALADAAPDSTTTLAVSFELADGQRQRAWIHAYRLSGAAAAAARRRCRRMGQKVGYTPRQETLFLAEFVLILTTVPPEALSAETVLVLYRCRWQVELLIKRWKSLLALDQLRARVGSALGEVWIYGKLVYAQLLERRLRRRGGAAWGRLDAQRTVSWWRLWKLMRQEIAPLITAVRHWTVSQWPAAWQAITERRRQRALQQIPAEVVAWLHQAKEEALAYVG